MYEDQNHTTKQNYTMKEDDDDDSQNLHCSNQNKSTSNQVFGLQTSTYHPFDAPPFCSSKAVKFYESKLFSDDKHGNVMDNFQINSINGGDYSSFTTHKGLFNIDMVGLNAQTTNIPFDYQKNTTKPATMPLSFVVPDEVSRDVDQNYHFYRKVGGKKNRRVLPLKKGGKMSHVVKGQWTLEEDKLLIRMVSQYGVRKWSQIAQMLIGRIGKQCRERWYNHLRPDIKKDIWTVEEDKVLIQTHKEMGNKWAEIAKSLPGRTENSIKNHWNATKRRQFSQRKFRSKCPKNTLLQDYIKTCNFSSTISPKRNQEKNVAPDATTLEGNSNDVGNKTMYHLQTQQILNVGENNQLIPCCDNIDDSSDFRFDENMFCDGFSFDSLLDEINMAPNADVAEKKDCELDFSIDIIPLMEFEVKKELDLVEMISQANL